MLAMRRLALWGALAILTSAFLGATPVKAQVTAFMQAVAEAAATDRDIAAFYRENGYSPIWTGSSNKEKQRRAALLNAIADAPMHGLPLSRYDVDTLKVNLKSVRSERDLGKLEVQMSKTFLLFARDIQTGILTPSEIDSEIVRKVPLRSRTSLLSSFAKSSPKAFLKALPPKSPEYARLMKEKLQYEKLIDRGGFGAKVASKSLKPGQSNQAVIQLRNRLIAMGYLRRNTATTYDERMRQAVAQFQRDHGLFTDGVAGARTMSMINTPATARLSQILVAMERERWTNMDRGARHIWVNLTDFSAQIVDNGKVTFQTRSVIGKNDPDRRSPEFSDVMEHMVINPTWYVPRSITTREYLPMLQQNPNAVRHLQIVRGGRSISREGIDFTLYNERNFPYDMRQPPSRSNALGLVKFMFPNRYNIYLHDTPAKKLFGREKRDFSHGCIRLNDPFDFAYALLAKQEQDPQAFFQDRLRTGNETYVDLDEHVPVHLVYRTAFTTAKGNMQFRGDVYGRDAKIWKALERAGVSLRGVQS